MLGSFLRWRNRKTVRRPVRPRTIPRLEVLERRDCPTVIVPPTGVTDTWIGNGSNNWSDPSQWIGRVPQPGDDVVFDGNYTQADCIFDGTGIAPGTEIANFITMQNGYGGTLHLAQASYWGGAAIGYGGVTLPSGDIEQDTGQEIDDYGDFNWSGGSLNPNSPFLADFKMQNAGTVRITGLNPSGTNLDLTNGSRAVMSLQGTSITFSKGAGINIDPTSAFNWTDGRVQVANGQPVGAIRNQGLFQKTIGLANVVSDDLPIANSGTFQLQQGSFRIRNKDANGNGFDNSGTCDLTGGTDLRCEAGGNFHQSAGNFWTEGTQTVNIVATSAVFDGGFINLNHGVSGGNTGSLSVTGALNIQGTAEWDCKVDCKVQPNMACDNISASGAVTLGGTSTFKAIAVNLAASGGRVPLNQSWFYLGAGARINTNFNTMSLAFNDGSGGSWTDEGDPTGTEWSLVS